MKRRASRIVIMAFMLLCGVVAAAALIISPIALSRVADLASAERWELLSQIGQAYGPVATLVSTAALVGVALSVAMQARSIRIAAYQGLITHQFEISRLMVENPMLVQAEGGTWRGSEDDLDIQLAVVVNQWITHWRTMYDLGLLTDDDVRHVAGHLFQGEAGRRFWIGKREHSRIGSSNRRKDRFHRLMDDELTRAEAVSLQPIVSSRSGPDASSRNATAAALGGVAIIGLVVLAHRRRNQARGLKPRTDR